MERYIAAKTRYVQPACGLFADEHREGVDAFALVGLELIDVLADIDTRHAQPEGDACQRRRQRPGR